MPVRKFRSVEEMNQPVWRDPGDPELYRTIAGLWEVGRRVGGAASSPACIGSGRSTRWKRLLIDRNPEPERIYRDANAAVDADHQQRSWPAARAPASARGVDLRRQPSLGKAW